jgi:hypothetical protein
MADVQESDEALARRLQNEELALGGRRFQLFGSGDGIPNQQGRLSDGDQDPEAPLLLADPAFDPNVARYHAFKRFAPFALWCILQGLSALIAFAADWNHPCEKPLKLWLAIFSLRNPVLFPIYLRRYRQMGEMSQADKRLQVQCCSSA